MFKGIQYVVETNSSEERKELVNQVFDNRLAASVISAKEGHQFIAISTGDVWFLTTISDEVVAKSHYQVFHSVDRFLTYLKGQEKPNGQKQ